MQTSGAWRGEAADACLMSMSALRSLWSEVTTHYRLRHSGMVRRTRPGISRFRVRCFASPRNDGFGLKRGACHGVTLDAAPSTRHDDEASAPHTWRRSGKRRGHASQSRQFHHHAVADGEPDGLDETAGQHDLAGGEAVAVGGEMIGEPGQRVTGLAEHVGAAALPDFLAVDP